MVHTERAGRARRDSDELRHMLDEIDEQGWDGPTATRLLTLIRESIARPLAIGAGLRGAAASQAEASAWAAVWEQLALRDVRQADEPWGVIWRTAQHAVANEVIAARYGTSPRRAWDIANGVGVHHAEQLVGLQVLDFHPCGTVEDDPAAELDMRASCTTAITALSRGRLVRGGRCTDRRARPAPALPRRGGPKRARLTRLAQDGRGARSAAVAGATTLRRAAGHRHMAGPAGAPDTRRTARPSHAGHAGGVAEHPVPQHALPRPHRDPGRRRVRDRLSTARGGLTDVHRNRQSRLRASDRRLRPRCMNRSDD